LFEKSKGQKAGAQNRKMETFSFKCGVLSRLHKCQAGIPENNLNCYLKKYVLA